MTPERHHAFIFEKTLKLPPLPTKEQLERFRIDLANEPTKYGKKRSACSQAFNLVVVSEYYRFLVSKRLILSDPVGFSYPKQKRAIPRDILSPEQLRRLVRKPDVYTARGMRDAVIVRLLALSGLRVSELCTLDHDQPDLTLMEIVLRLGKGRKDRLVFFDEGTRSIISKYLISGRPKLMDGSTPSLLVSDSGRRIQTHQVRKIVRDYARAVRLSTHITPHSLRRTFCTLMLRAGVNLKALAELAGHESLGTTARYAAADISVLSEVYRQAHPRCER